MKIRNGFVSNSSSSSYIVAAKRSEPCQLCHRRDPNLLALLPTKGDFEDTRYVYDRKGLIEELQKIIEYTSSLILRPMEEYIIESHKKEKENAQKLIDKINAIPEDMEVAKIEISYHDEAFNELFASAVANGSLIVVEILCE